MNENIDLREILKNAPEGMELYSAIHGPVKFGRVYTGVNGSNFYPIEVLDDQDCEQYYTADGKYFNLENAECVLFPSKENRDWSTFKIPRWRAERGSHYFYVTSWGEIYKAADIYSGNDDQAWKSGNYFKTVDEAVESKIYNAFNRE
jgi:hypothetical protein